MNRIPRPLLAALLAIRAFAQDASPPADAPAPLPGKGLAQHDFLYSGEWDTRKPVQTMFLVKGGKVVWTYEIPIKDANGNLSEYSDMHRLSNGDIVFAYKTGWRKINEAGATIYDYQCPKGESGWTECHSAQPIGKDKVLFMQNGVPAKLFLYNLKTGQTEMEHVMRTKEPVDQKSVHGQFRNVRMTKAGTFLIAHMNLGKVIEYDKDWNEIWSCEAPSFWHAARLKNGNTLISGNQHGFVREINPTGEIVWEREEGRSARHPDQRRASGDAPGQRQHRLLQLGRRREEHRTGRRSCRSIEVTPEKQGRVGLPRVDESGPRPGVVHPIAR